MLEKVIFDFPKNAIFIAISETKMAKLEKKQIQRTKVEHTC